MSFQARIKNAKQVYCVCQADPELIPLPDQNSANEVHGRRDVLHSGMASFSGNLKPVSSETNELDQCNEDGALCKAINTISEFQQTLDESSLKELEVMKSIGLPTYFLNSQRDSEQVSLS